MVDRWRVAEHYYVLCDPCQTLLYERWRGSSLPPPWLLLFLRWRSVFGAH